MAHQQKREGGCMKRKQMRDAIRGLVDDNAVPYLWADTLLNTWIAEARLQAARRSRSLVSSTDTACKISIPAGAISSLRPARVISIRKIRIEGQTQPLEKIHHDDVDMRFPDWKTQTGTIEGYCLGIERRKIHWLYGPAVASTAYLTAALEPTEWDNDDEDDPDFMERHQYGLFDWVLFRLYSKRDSDSFSPDLAKAHEDAFTREFGPASTAVEEAWADENYNFTDDGSR